MPRKKVRPEPDPAAITLAKACLTKRCGNQYRHGAKDGSARGLCPKCYQAAKRLVAYKEASWRELEDLGLAEPPLRKRKGWDTTFHDEFLRRKLRQNNNDQDGYNDDYVI